MLTNEMLEKAILSGLLHHRDEGRHGCSRYYLSGLIGLDPVMSKEIGKALQRLKRQGFVRYEHGLWRAEEG